LIRTKSLLFQNRKNIKHLINKSIIGLGNTDLCFWAVQRWQQRLLNARWIFV